MPSSIAIITDTDSSLPASLAEQLGIQQVPITVQFANETFDAQKEINDAQLFARIDRENRLPTTSAPSPARFSQAFQSAFDGGAETILCLCVSSIVSATYNNALMAVRDDFPGRDITVIDTLSLTMGQGFIVQAVAEAALAGATMQELIDLADAVRQRSHLFAALSTLKYLAMSGRVGHIAAGMAGFLNIKPILTIREGKLDMLEKVRTRSKSLDRVLELARQEMGDKPVERMAIVHVNALEEANKFEAKVRASLSCPDEILYAELTPGLSVHSGSGLLGVAFVTK
jgi:DegV family protein with EDD domain